MKKVIFAVLLLGLGVALGAWLGVSPERWSHLSGLLPLPSSPPTSPIAESTEAHTAQSGEEKKILYWVAPMDPNYRRDKPGKSPMGMDLVPVYADEAGEDSIEGGPVVKIAPAVVNNLGVRTAPVERGPLWRRIGAVGYIAFDENRISHIHLRTDGWIERLRVKAEGERVKKGQLLFELYSPELVNAQEEFIQALASGNQGLIRASRNRLRALGVAESQIKKLGATREVVQWIRTYAPQSGIVSALNVREGMHVEPATVVMSLVDLSSIWLLAEVFERQADWVEVGQSAEASLAYLPGKVWEGQVDFVYPELDPVTRTLKVRLRFDNPEEALKPNMYAQVAVYAGPKRAVLSLPREALIRSSRGDRVVMALGEGRFQVRDVVAGIESGDWVEIVSGLAEGEEVVVSSQFLIDSESSVKASFTRMQEPETQAPAEATAVAEPGKQP